MGSAQFAPNIDFEQGNFQYWYNAAYNVPFPGGSGCGSTTPNPPGANGFNFTAPNIYSDNHSICYGNWFDPCVTTSAVPIPCPWGGQISARLGDIYDSCGMAQMSYSMNVNANNTDVAFSYAVVLFDNHQPAHAPKFIYVVRDIQTGITFDSAYFDSNTIATDTAFHPADPNIPGLYYKNWTKVCVPLMAHLGSTVSFDFITSDCDDGYHRGYAYLDFNMNSCFTTNIHSSNSLENSLKLFPNPASDKLNLTLNNLENDEIKITLHDIQGNLFINENIAAAPGQASRTYDIKDLSRGIYFVSLRSKSRGNTQKKLIIN